MNRKVYRRNGGVMTLLSDLIEKETPMKSFSSHYKKETKPDYDMLADEAAKEAIEAFRAEFRKSLLLRKNKRASV